MSSASMIKVLSVFGSLAVFERDLVGSLFFFCVLGCEAFV